MIRLSYILARHPFIVDVDLDSCEQMQHALVWGYSIRSKPGRNEKAESRKMVLPDISLQSWKYCNIFWNEKVESGDIFIGQTSLNTAVGVYGLILLNCLAGGVSVDENSRCCQCRRLQIGSPMLVVWILKTLLSQRFEWECFDFAIRMDRRWQLWLTNHNTLAHLLAKKTNLWLKKKKKLLEGSRHPLLLSITFKFRKSLALLVWMRVFRFCYWLMVCLVDYTPSGSPLGQEDKSMNQKSPRSPRQLLSGWATLLPLVSVTLWWWDAPMVFFFWGFFLGSLLCWFGGGWLRKVFVI